MAHHRSEGEEVKGHGWGQVETGGQLGRRSTRCFHLTQTRDIMPTFEVRKLRNRAWPEARGQQKLPCWWEEGRKGWKGPAQWSSRAVSQGPRAERAAWALRSEGLRLKLGLSHSLAAVKQVSLSCLPCKGVLTVSTSSGHCEKQGSSTELASGDPQTNGSALNAAVSGALGEEAFSDAKDRAL